MTTFLIVSIVVCFVALFTVDAGVRVGFLWHQRVTLRQPRVQVVLTPQPKPHSKPQSVGAAVVNYSSMTVRELRALCSADPQRFKGYSTALKQGGKAALIDFMEFQRRNGHMSITTEQKLQLIEAERQGFI